MDILSSPEHSPNQQHAVLKEVGNQQDMFKMKTSELKLYCSERNCVTAAVGEREFLNDGFGIFTIL